jgi:putative nucleotidyltransferase with HDIG domain
VQELCTDVRRLFGPKAETTFVNLLCALWSGRATFQHETDMRTLDGQIRRCVISLPLPQDMEAARQVPVSIIDITEQTEAEEQARSLGARLEKASLDAVGAVAAMVERRDPYTSGHQANVAALSVEIARKLGWDRFKIEGLRLGAMIHDIGKISVPSEILNRPGKLTDSEFAIIKAHPETGYDILKGTDFPWPIREMILQHHERLDGSGYPAGMRGDAILDETRVLSVADVLDAITSHRPYRPSRGIETALKEIEDGRGTYYDPAVVDAALELIRDEGYRWQKDLHESD